MIVSFRLLKYAITIAASIAALLLIPQSANAATGGGCSGWSSLDTWGTSAKACVSAAAFGEINPSGYLSGTYHSGCAAQILLVSSVGIQNSAIYPCSNRTLYLSPEWDILPDWWQVAVEVNQNDGFGWRFEAASPKLYGP